MQLLLFFNILYSNSFADSLLKIMLLFEVVRLFLSNAVCSCTVEVFASDRTIFLEKKRNIYART